MRLILFRLAVVMWYWWRGLSVEPSRRWRWALGIWTEWVLATVFIAALLWGARRLLGI